MWPFSAKRGDTSDNAAYCDDNVAYRAACRARGAAAARLSGVARDAKIDELRSIAAPTNIDLRELELLTRTRDADALERHKRRVIEREDALWAVV